MSLTATARQKLPRLSAFSIPGRTARVLALIVALAAMVGALSVGMTTVARFIVGGLGGVVFFVIATSSRYTALRLIVVWLIFLGLIRRFLIPFAGWSDQDPLIMVGPAAAVMIWLNGRHDSPPRRDPLTISVVFFLLWSMGQIVNPSGGPLMQSMFQALWWIGPLLWFFVGKTFPVSAHEKVVGLVTVLAIPVAVHGLYQTYVGLLPFEYTWLGVSDFGPSIFYEGFKIRSFSTLGSPQEYGAVLAFALAFIWASILAGEGKRGWKLAAFTFLTVALFLQGGRSAFGFFLLMVGVTTLIWIKEPGKKLALLAAALALVGLLSNASAPQISGASGAAVAARHQIEGLLAPTQSTLPLHLALIGIGFEKSFDHPLGLGIGPLAGAAAGEELGLPQTSTENDVAQTFMVLGLPAGLVYVAFLIMLYAAAGRRFRLLRSAYSLGVIGVLVAATFQLWGGRMYAFSALVWFTLGGLTRPVEEALLEPSEALDGARSEMAGAH